ncbi:outer membrane porin protein [Vibrio maritimus]|uniref:Outer membrane porin protein n=1 Tax=Vibrio maritimus TaxID=990268 RepID=A0A090T1C2_9VIBR|nr:outer membrane porin protein [Vibrio maritimus]
MEKMFKRTLLGAAVASLTMAGAVQAKPATDTVDLYGQVAISVWQVAEDKFNGGDAPIKMDNESRFGLRGSHELARGPKFIWQLEGGNVLDDGANSGLGVRDTYGGFEFENAGRIRFGRMLAPTYEIIDWPYSSTATGKVFDWGGDIIGGARYDRQSNMVRYDSANLGGFTFNLAAGRGTEDVKDSNFFDVGAHYTAGVFTLHGGYQVGQDRQIDALNSLLTRWWKQNPNQEPTWAEKFDAKGESDTQAGILGFEVALDTFKLFGAVKQEMADYDNITVTYTPAGATDSVTETYRNLEMKQLSYSAGVVYSGVDNWLFKANYAANMDVELQGDKIADTADSIVSAEALYFLDDSALTYVRPYMIDRDASGYEFGWGVGVEYYF